MDSFNCVYVMYVFGVKYRLGLIDSSWRDELYAVIGSLVKKMSCTPLAIGGTSDHVHILVSVGGDAPSLKDIVRHVKTNSSKWVNSNRLCVGRFGWQEGNGKFSYSYREKMQIVSYIRNQEQHHTGMSFREEMRRLNTAAHIYFKDDYLPKEPI